MNWRTANEDRESTSLLRLCCISRPASTQDCHDYAATSDLVSVHLGVFCSSKYTRSKMSRAKQEVLILEWGNHYSAGAPVRNRT